MISLTHPDIFLTSLNIVGGVGIVVLFGILPAIIALLKARSGNARMLAILMLALFSTCLLLEIAQETGFLRIKPQVEYWSSGIATPRF